MASPCQEEHCRPITSIINDGIGSPVRSENVVWVGVSQEDEDDLATIPQEIRDSAKDRCRWLEEMKRNATQTKLEGFRL